MRVPLPLVATTDGGGTAPGGGNGGTEPGSPEESALSVKLYARALTEARKGKPFSVDFANMLDIKGKGAEGVTPESLTWAITQGGLPEGLALIGSVVAGVPTKLSPGTEFELTVTHPESQGMQTYTIQVGEATLRVRQVAAGFGTNCAVTDIGGVKCWGSNMPDNLLGNIGGATFSAVPVSITGLESGVKSVHGGTSSNFCAVTDAGAVKCWGGNVFGVLGVGVGPSSSIPVQVQGLSEPAVSASVGTFHACALMASGSVSCWGSSYVGTGVLESKVTAVNVPGFTSNVKKIFAGPYGTCAVLGTGAVKCVDQSPANAGPGLSPVDHPQLTGGIAEVYPGFGAACALTTAGAVKCWGGVNGSTAWVGSVVAPDQLIPSDVIGLSSGAVSLSTYSGNACAVLATGGVKCWGQNMYGLLGDGTETAHGVPIDVPGVANAVSVSMGSANTCVKLSSGVAKCWGLGMGLGNPEVATGVSRPMSVME